MEKMVDVTKGSRVHVERFKVNENTSLAGAQLKFGGEFQKFTGTIRHIRGNHPFNPTKIGFWVQPDTEVEDAVMCEKCGVLEVGPLFKQSLTPILDDEDEPVPSKTQG